MLTFEPNSTTATQEAILGQLDHTMGHLRGKTLDIDDKTIQGCKIWIRETGHSAYSDENGNFILINIFPAIYTLIVEHEGFSPCIAPDVPIGLGDNPGFRFTMIPLQASQPFHVRYNPTHYAY
jgi:hypothetical protein